MNRALLNNFLFHTECNPLCNGYAACHFLNRLNPCNFEAQNPYFLLQNNRCLPGRHKVFQYFYLLQDSLHYVLQKRFLILLNKFLLHRGKIFQIHTARLKVCGHRFRCKYLFAFLRILLYTRR